MSIRIVGIENAPQVLLDYLMFGAILAVSISIVVIYLGCRSRGKGVTPHKPRARKSLRRRRVR